VCCTIWFNVVHTTIQELSPGEWSLLLKRVSANTKLSKWDLVVKDTSLILDQQHNHNDDDDASSTSLALSSGAVAGGGGGGGGGSESTDTNLMGAKRGQVVLALSHRINARRALKQLDKSLVDCERLFTLANTRELQVSALSSRALVYAELKRWDDAIGDCDAATLLSSPVKKNESLKSRAVAIEASVDSGDRRNEDSSGNGRGEEVLAVRSPIEGLKDQNLMKVGRLRQWIIVQKEQETKEAIERAERMAKLLVAEVCCV
jgi:tetratricopeptide (TPR) repeat protein